MNRAVLAIGPRPDLFDCAAEPGRAIGHDEAPCGEPVGGEVAAELEPVLRHLESHITREPPGGSSAHVALAQPQAPNGTTGGQRNASDGGAKLSRVRRRGHRRALPLADTSSHDTVALVPPGERKMSYPGCDPGRHVRREAPPC